MQDKLLKNSKDQLVVFSSTKKFDEVKFKQLNEPLSWPIKQSYKTWSGLTGAWTSEAEFFFFFYQINVVCL